ncbi:hypothetical protein LguiA_024346 [Lonicera macranthoides]
MGTPHHTLSNVEFHPQCDTNPTTDLCDSTAICGAHPTTFPTPAVRSKNPSGRISPGSENSPGNSNFPFSTGLRSDHRNLWPLCSKASAISFTCFSSKLPMLPKHRNTTDESGCSSSQSIIVLLESASLTRFNTGPTG